MIIGLNILTISRGVFGCICLTVCPQVYSEGKLGSNPFKKEQKRPASDPAVLAALKTCRGVGPTSASALLENFPSKLCYQIDQQLDKSS